MMTRDVMIDIETLSTRPDALILTIGAVRFRRDGGEILPKDKFYVRVCIDSCKRYGLHVEPDTLEWWSRQNERARYEAVENTDRVALPTALDRLSKFFGANDIVWANSPSFDCVILENAYRACGKVAPWKFWNLRDCRTIKDIACVRSSGGSSKEPNHHAIDDCLDQVATVQKCFARLNKK